MNFNYRAVFAQARERIPFRLRPATHRLRRALLPYLGEVVYRHRAVRGRFHPPSPNNYVHVLVPRTHSLTEYLNGMHSSVQPLNDADGELLAFVRRYLEAYPDQSDLGVLGELHRWQIARAERRFLDATEPMEKLFWLLSEKRRAPLVDLIEDENPEILDRFLSMPTGVARAFRFNFFVPPSAASEMVESFLEETVGRPKWGHAIDRIETAIVSPRGRDARHFPTWMLYLKPGFARDEPAVVEEMKSWFSGRLGFDAEPRNAPRRYAEEFHPRATCTEGYRLYKRYLAALCRLDVVYDAGKNFAYVR